MSDLDMTLTGKELRADALRIKKEWLRNFFSGESVEVEGDGPVDGGQDGVERPATDEVA